MGCRKQELDSPLHYEVQSKLAYNLIMHFINTIIAWREVTTLPGHHHPVPTQLCCWAGKAVENGLRRFCRVRKLKQALIILPGGETFALRNSGYGACGIPDEETIVLTGGFRHNFVTR